MAPLQGDELIAKVNSLPNASRTELCMATGFYRERDGKIQRQFSKLYRALLEARGQALDGRIGSRKDDRPLSYRTSVLSHGGILLGKRYVEQLGLKHGDQAVIEIKGGTARLKPVGENRPAA